jgi:hypothetical protein
MNNVLYLSDYDRVLLKNLGVAIPTDAQRQINAKAEMAAISDAIDVISGAAVEDATGYSEAAE